MVRRKGRWNEKNEATTILKFFGAVDQIQPDKVVV